MTDHNCDVKSGAGYCDPGYYCQADGCCPVRFKFRRRGRGGPLRDPLGDFLLNSDTEIVKNPRSERRVPVPHRDVKMERFCVLEGEYSILLKDAPQNKPRKRILGPLWHSMPRPAPQTAPGPHSSHQYTSVLTWCQVYAHQWRLLRRRDLLSFGPDLFV